MNENPNHKTIILLASSASVHTWRWAIQLKQAGWKIQVFTRDRDEPFDYGDIPIKRTLFSGKMAYILNAPQLRNYARSVGADLIHAFYATEYGLLVALSGFRPVLLSVMGSDVFDYPRKSILHKWYVKRVLLAADTVASTSRVMGDEVGKLTFGRVKPEITPFSVDTDAFSPASIPVFSGDVIRICSVRHLHRRYGLDLLIHAFAKARDQVPDKTLNLDIVGSGPQHSELKKLAADLGVRDDITFFGKLQPEELPNFYRARDIAVLPSREESFGVAAIEASSCGLPVVASNTGGLPEVVSDQKTGLLFKSGDINALADALLELIHDPDRARKMGMNGREWVIHTYSKEICTKKMSDVYRSVLSVQSV